MNATAIFLLWRRELLGFFRQRSRVIGALATPLLFWALIGSGLGRSFQDPAGHSSGGYLPFFFPGMLALNVLFTAIFSTISLIQDRQSGFLQGVLVAPVPRSTLLWAKVLGGGTLGLIQGVLLLPFAPLAGLTLSLAALPSICALMFLMGAVLTMVGYLFAWKIESVQGFHGVMNTVLMPLWILSGAMFPPAGSHPALAFVMSLNPLTYALAALRSLLSGGHDGFLLAVAVLGGTGMMLFALCLAVMKAKRRGPTFGGAAG